MREIDRLRPLQMRVAGDDDGGVLRAELHEGFLELPQLALQRGDLVAQPEPHVERDLVVARAGGVELRASGHALGEFRLDVHVDIFERGPPLEFPSGDLGGDLFQTPRDGREFGGLQHADLAQHRGVRDGAANVVRPQPPVEGDGFRECGDIGGRTAGEPSTARDNLFHGRECIGESTRGHAGNRRSGAGVEFRRGLRLRFTLARAR